MAKKRNLLLLAAVAGVGVYLFTRKAGASAPAPSVARPMTSNPALGDRTDPNSIAYACETARTLIALGHPVEAAPWLTKCQRGGGGVLHQDGSWALE